VLPRTLAAAAAAVVVVIAGTLASAVPAGTSRNGSAASVRTQTLSLDLRIVADINAARATHGLASVRVSHALGMAAGAHSREMVRDGYFSHDSASGASAWTRVARYYSSSGFRRWQVGETILWYSPGVDAAQTVRDWLASPRHRAILLAPAFREIGVSAVHAAGASGAFHGDEITVVTADFGVRSR
jgi:uncharacterized protein YkwD